MLFPTSPASCKTRFIAPVYKYFSYQIPLRMQNRPAPAAGRITLVKTQPAPFHQRQAVSHSQAVVKVARDCTKSKLAAVTVSKFDEGLPPK